MVHYNEFQAVVLAGGKGSRMIELTAGQPKCLLPIANIPKIWYPLQILERSGFKEAIVVVSELAKSEVSTTLDRLGLKIKMEIIGIPGTEDLGTADSIRLIHEKIKHNASITVLMLPVPKVPDDFVTPGPKSKQKLETDLIGIDNNTGRLVLLDSVSDFEETFNISQGLLRKHRKTVELRNQAPQLDCSLQIDGCTFNELLPYIVSKQLSRPKQSVDDRNTSMVQVDVKEDIFRFAAEKPLDELIRKMSAFNDHSTDLEEVYYGDIIRCYGHMSNEQFGLRANTVQMYHFANAKILEWWSADGKNTGQLPLLPSISSTSNIRSTQMQECCIDDDTTTVDKASLKHSHIGPNSVVESKTRISQSVIMGHVTIKQRCLVHNCILCNGCIVEEGSELKDCLVGAQHIVTSGSQHYREVLTDADRLIEI